MSKIFWTNEMPKSYRADCSSAGTFVNAMVKGDEGAKTLTMLKIVKIVPIFNAKLFAHKTETEGRNQIVVYFINEKKVLSNMIVRTSQSLQTFKYLPIAAFEEGKEFDKCQILCKMIKVTEGEFKGYHYVSFGLKTDAEGKVLDTPAEVLKELENKELYDTSNIYDLRILEDLAKNNGEDILVQNSSVLPANHKTLPLNIQKKLNA